MPAAVEVIERRQAAGWIAGMKAGTQVAVFREEIGPWRPTAASGVLMPKPIALSPGHVTLDVPGGGERLLATSIAGSRGWSARAGGCALKTLTVNGAFLGVQLPAGASRVELRYLPPGFTAGCVLFVLSVAVLFLSIGASKITNAVAAVLVCFGMAESVSKGGSAAGLSSVAKSVDLDQLFTRLAREWEEATRFISSTTEIVTHPAYQRIIGLGPAALPLIFRQLSCDPDHWSWALKAITGEDPVPPAARGNLGKMKEAWLQWGIARGFVVAH